jgi:hypothetical protein
MKTVFHRIGRGLVAQLAGSLGAPGQKLYIVMVKIREEAAQLVPGTSESERLAVGTSSERKAAGTRPPSAASKAESSPNDAVFPPTSGMSFSLIFSNQRT